MSFQWKVFIAYHGTYDDEGSARKAEELYKLLNENNINCYCYLVNSQCQNADFMGTPNEAAHSHLFVFVANSKLSEKLNEQGELQDGNSIYEEMEAYYRNRIFNKSKENRGRILIYCYDGFDAEKADGLFPKATRGIAHFDEGRDGEQRAKEELLKLVINSSIANQAKSKRTPAMYASYGVKDKKQALEVLGDKEQNNSYLYIETILKHYINRHVYFYTYRRQPGVIQSFEKEKDVKTDLHAIRRELQRPRGKTKNIIFVGAGGSGKSTSLKWLFANTKKRGFCSIYLNNRSFPTNLASLDELLCMIETIVDQNRPALVYLDGLDEFSCIKGDKDEFGKIIDFIDVKSSRNGGGHKFIISTRPEHFGLNKRIRQKQSGRNLDNYRIYEFLPLTRKEAYKICKSIKYLSQFDKKYKGPTHFLHKWPDNNGFESRLSERQYLKQLKEYLQSTDMEKSLLSSPLLCRYAYQIVCEWSGKDGIALNDSTQSERFLTILKICLKWEFHDMNPDRMKGENGKKGKDLTKYQNKVLSFLTSVAGAMKEENKIEKKVWRAIKAQKKIAINAALSVMEEVYSPESDSEGEYLAFLHKSFYEYFIACYYAIHLMELNELQKGTLCVTLCRNPSVAHMFAEQLIKSKDPLIYNVCFWIFDQHSKRHHQMALSNSIDDSYQYLVKLYLGDYSFHFERDTPFTVEEFFSVFSYGRIMLAGNELTKIDFTKLQNGGILEITDPGYLSSINLDQVGADKPVKGLALFLPKEDVLYHYLSFKLMGKAFHGLCGFTGGYYTQRADSDKMLIKKLAGEPETRQYIEEGRSLSELLKNENVKRIVLEFQSQEKKQIDLEAEKIRVILYALSQKMLKEVDPNSNYWCLQHDNICYVFMQTSENAQLLADRIETIKSNHLSDVICLYGQYLARSRAAESLEQQIVFTKMDQINIRFSEHDTPQKRDRFSTYYLLHWNIMELLKNSTSPINLEKIDFNISQKVLRVIELFDTYPSAEEEQADQLLDLIFSDERILLDIFISDISGAQALASESLALCEKYGHVMGKKLRQLILEEEISKMFLYAKEFALNHIWMCKEKEENTDTGSVEQNEAFAQESGV